MADTRVYGAEHSDIETIIYDDLDPTKELQYELAALTTGTIRTWTVPDQDLDLTPGSGDFAASGGAPATHAASHTDGSDDIQNATASVKGLATAVQITKLDAIEASATADQTDAEIETAYNNQVGIVSQVDAEAGTATVAERWTPQRVSQAIAALASGATQLSELSDVTSATVTDKFALMADGAAYVGRALVEADISDYAPVSATMARVAGSTFSTVQHMQDIFHSSGISTGGEITDDADGTITVAAGTGFIRATNSSVAEILFTDWAAEAGANVTLTDNDMNYIYVEYNAGSPQAIATITKRTDESTNLLLGTVYRIGTSLHITENTRAIVGDHALNMILRLRATEPFKQVSGGILSETGTRNIAITAGTWWEDLTEFTTGAFDSSGADTFLYYYDNGAGGWTEVTSQSQIDNTQYDDGSGTLATLSGNNYAVHWVYLAQDDDEYVVYGTIDGGLSTAQDATPPASVPPHFAEAHARLIGKIIIRKSEASFTSIESSFEIEFTPSVATDHGGLIGLADDDHTQYLLADGSRTLSGNLVITGTVDGVDIAAEETRLQNTSGTNTGDESAASLTVAGIIEIATGAETNTGTDATRAVSPDGLDDWTGSAQITTLGAITSVTSLNMADSVLQRAELVDYSEEVTEVGGSGGGTQDFDLAVSNVHTVTVDTSANTFTFSNPPASGKAGSLTLIITNGGSQTVNWPASVDWASATAPTLTAAGVDIITFMTVDGGTIWHGFAASLDSS